MEFIIAVLFLIFFFGKKVQKLQNSQPDKTSGSPTEDIQSFLSQLNIDRANQPERLDVPDVFSNSSSEMMSSNNGDTDEKLFKDDQWRVVLIVCVILVVVVWAVFVYFS